MPDVVGAVLFDFGGVFTPSPFHAVRAAGASLGVAPELALRLCFGSYDDDTAHPWHRLERGEVTLEAARAGILALAADQGCHLDPFEVLAGSGGSTIRPDVVDAVRDVRRRHIATAMVTNNIAEFRERWTALLPVGELFDVVVDSSEVGIRKPDPRIYALALDRLGGIAPERAVFLDDAPGNVTAARAAGLTGVLVGADPTEALTELRRLLTTELDAPAS